MEHPVRGGSARRWKTPFVGISLILLLSLQPAFSRPTPGGPSMKDKAETALVAGDAELAASLYERWLEANPGDVVAWYNYACAFALLGRKDEALRTLEDAVTAGWRDSTWTSRDPDLTTLHGDLEFARILDRIGELSRLERASVTRRPAPLYTLQQRIAPYRVALPAVYSDQGPPHPVTILLHGRGGDMDDQEDLPVRLALPDMVYLLPRAPYPVSEQTGGFEYWPREAFLVGDTARANEAQRLTALWLRDLVRDAANRLNLDTSRVFLVGFSQGAAMAYIAAEETPSLYLGAGALCGYLPEGRRDSTAFLPLARGKVALFIAHGDRDRVFNVSEANLARDLASAAGVEVTAHTYPVGHDICDEMVVDLGEWMLALLQKRNP